MKYKVAVYKRMTSIASVEVEADNVHDAQLKGRLKAFQSSKPLKWTPITTDADTGIYDVQEAQREKSE